MEASITTTEQEALDRAVAAAGGKTALRRALNVRGHAVNSHTTIRHWRVNGVPEKYCPDIEDITGVRCEELCPGTNWAVLRKTSRRIKAG